MKKLLLLIGVFLLVGCESDLNNTPTKRVEMFLSKYQTLDAEVVTNIESSVKKDTELTDDQQDKYIEFWKSHYQDLTYTVKDEEVDGDEAIVKVEVEVNDYTKVIDSANTYLKDNPNEFLDTYQKYDITKFNDYKLEQLKKNADRVKYTFDFKVNKVDKQWQLQDLSDEDYLKLSGMYAY